jgi:molybdate transport system substrate-binding protein
MAITKWGLRLTLKLIIPLVILALLIAIGVFTEYHMIQQQARVELRVFAASSLTYAIHDNGTLQTFEQQNGMKILFNIGGSDALYQQILSGSPADVFMAADSSWMQKLDQNGFLYDNQYWNFTSNVLVVVLPPDNPGNITSLLDLVRPGIKIAITAWTVPAGKYTNLTLSKIDKSWGTPTSSHYKGSQWEHYRQRVIANIVTYETNVEQVVGKVLTDSVDGGFAYMSDTAHLGQSRVKYLLIPSDVNIQAKYSIGVLNESRYHDLAMEYVRFWTSQDGQALLAKYGFSGTLYGTSTSIGDIVIQVHMFREETDQTVFEKVRSAMQA